MDKLLSAILVSLFCFSCNKHADPAISDCMTEKINTWKEITRAEAIIKITHSSSTLFWFVDSFFDSGEEIFDQNCELVCVTDTDFIGPSICADSVFQGTREIIWKK